MAATNVSGTERLDAAAAEADVERFVFASTVGAHPAVPGPDESPYQRSKAGVEDLLFDREHPFDVAAVYPTYIFGPRDYRLTRYEHVRPVATNRVLVPPLYTFDEYNVVHVADVVDSLVHCLDGATGRHLVTGPNLSTKRVLGVLADAVPGDCTVVPVPYRLVRWVVGPSMDLLHRAGVSPVPGAGFLERGDYGTVPADLTRRAPVPRRPWEAAIRDTVDWYDAVGLL
jgi:NADH dehydrogenase